MVASIPAAFNSQDIHHTQQVVVEAGHKVPAVGHTAEEEVDHTVVAVVEVDHTAEEEAGHTVAVVVEVGHMVPSPVVEVGHTVPSAAEAVAADRKDLAFWIVPG